ncbi:MULTISPECIES: MFS transporter [unclassified Arthrobacter]|uniref:MFS transporter n=1 Tax=unclassified Arthrobacter TaxID=235627 RepID=UPI00159D7C2B|nr:MULTISPECIES: MFS transporter [unclassified Arthrobacter]MCQ9165589.1 MFS transporter [Arthrobacter sp. STN4]NVN00239.1 MFS transporter [Arthrobacter sp. SDTb3-6]
MTVRSEIPPHTLRAAVAHGRMNRRAWLVTGALVVFQIINFADKAVLGLVADSAMRDLGLTAGQFGFIGSAFFFLFAISAVLVGFLAGRVPTRWIIVSMGVCWAVLQFPMLLGGGAAVLLVARILLGAAEGPATPITLQNVHGWFPAKERGLPSSLIAIGSTLGPIIAAPILMWIIVNPALGWRWAFGFLGLAGLAWTLCWLLVGREGPYSHHSQSKGLAEAAPGADQAPLKPAGASITDRADLLQVVPIRRVLGSGMFVAAVLAGAGCFWAQGFLTTWSPKYLSSVVSLGPEMIGVVSTLPWAVGALTLMVLGYSSRFLMCRGVTVRWALGALFGAALLLSGASFLVLPHTHGFIAVSLLTVAAGLALVFPLAPTAVAFCVGSRQRAAVMATLTGLASLGGVIAPAMVGMLMDNTGYRPSAKGVPESAHMITLLTHGMNTSFTMIGVYLVVVGIGCILLLNPDSTATRLQQRFACNG